MRKWLPIVLLCAWPLLAQKYTGPRPAKPDLPYLMHADNLIPAESAEAKQEDRKGEVTYLIPGANSTVRTPLASPAFLILTDQLQADPKPASSKMDSATSETGSVTSKMLSATSELKLETSKMILEDGFGAKNGKKTGFSVKTGNSCPLLGGKAVWPSQTWALTRPASGSGRGQRQRRCQTTAAVARLG